MPIKNTCYNWLITMLLTLTTISSIAQVLDKKSENTFVIHSTNKKFQSIELQKYKSLPRVGVINTYGEDMFNNIVQKAHSENAKYFALLKMKSLKILFQEIDKNLPYEVKYKNKSIPSDQRNSYEAQKHLKVVVELLLTPEEHTKYFGSPRQNGRPSISWGGASATEFQQVKSYTNFVKNDFDEIQKYADSLVDEVYLILPLKFQNYDFENEGFPVLLKHSSKLPVHTHTIWPHSQRYKPIFKVPFSKAEGFLTKIQPSRQVYGVFKIKFKCQGNMDYDLTRPSVELYADEALVNKIGELTIQNN